MKLEISLNFSDCPPQFENYFLPILETKYRIRRDERPDFLIYALTGHRHRLYNCVKIYVHHETYAPDWSQCDYAVLPIWSPDPRQLHVPIFAFDRSPQPLIRGGDEDWKGIRASKTHFCALLSSYVDRTVARRALFFQALNRRKRVHSSGRGINNTGFSAPPGHAAKLDFLRPYRFTIAFENKERLGWTTEKIYDPFAVHTIPIFWGDRRVARYFNPQSFINAHDFASLAELADYVCYVDETPELYDQYLKATPFINNTPPEEFSRQRVLTFFDKVFTTPLKPIAQKRWFFRLTKWRLAKRNKLLTE
ncbi:hypothetical protein EBX31_09365 [bacterium]|nr:hypothetical protein [bacterium]